MGRNKIRLAFILCAGADNAGGNTIANQVEKIKSDRFEFKIFCNVKNEYSFGCNEKENRTKNFVMYSNYRELFGLLQNNFDAVFIITQPRRFDKGYVKMLNLLRCKKILLAVDRSLRTVKKTIGEYSQYMNLFDCILTFGDESTTVHSYLKGLNENVFDFDFNFFDWSEMRSKSKKQKKKVVVYAGRYANFKGYNKLIQHRHEVLKNLKGLKVCIAGGSYVYSKERGLSSTIGILCTICEDSKSKKLKDHIVINGDYKTFYDDETENIHLFPSFANSDINDIFFNSLFCIMPTKYESKKRNSGMFRLAIEYTWLEAINNGTPIICTEEYGNECEVNGKKLIDCDCGLVFISSFSELREKIKSYLKDYDENVKKMQKFFKENYSNDFRIKAIEDLLEKLK